MFKKIKEGYCLEILKLEEKNIIIGCLRNPNSYDEDDDIYYIPSPLLAFIEDYEYIVKYLDQGYHFLCYMENNNYTTKILIDDNKDSYKSNLKTVATSSHPIIDYAFYMINDDLKRRERLKNSLTLIKGGKKWKADL